VHRGRVSALAGVVVAAVAAVPPAASITDAAPPDGGQVHVGYRVDADGPARICARTDNVLSVRVTRVVSGVQTNTTRLVGGTLTENMPDVVIDASGGAPVITLQDTSRVTWLDGDRVRPTANFRFHADQAGETSVHLTAHIADMADVGWSGPLEDREVDVPVRVVNCRFDVSMFSRFRVEGPANLQFAAGFNHAVLEPSSDGELRQSVTLTWLTSVSGVGDCLGQTASRTSEVVLLGSLDGDGVLTVDVRYEPFAFELTGNCGGFATEVTPSPLRLTIGSPSGRIDQVLTAPLGDAPGAAVYLVVPLDGEP
jgi:hypothetical protein